MKRQMKEGIQGRRHGGTGARGDFGVEKLVAADDEGKREARRLGMATSDDEESGDENAKAGNVDEVDSNDEMLEMDQAIKMRHFGRKMALNDSDESSDDSDVEELVNTCLLYTSPSPRD